MTNKIKACGRFFLALVYPFSISNGAALLFLVVGALISWQFYIIHRVALQNQRALCTIKAERIHRTIEAKRFLKEHPNGTPGFTKYLIKRSIHTSEADAKALDDVQCSSNEVKEYVNIH